MNTSHLGTTKEALGTLFDFIDQKIDELGIYHIQLTDEVQMNEFAALLGLPLCEHGREFAANVVRCGAQNPDATEFFLGRTEAK